MLPDRLATIRTTPRRSPACSGIGFYFSSSIGDRIMSAPAAIAVHAAAGHPPQAVADRRWAGGARARVRSSGARAGTEFLTAFADVAAKHLTMKVAYDLLSKYPRARTQACLGGNLSQCSAGPKPFG